MWSEIPYWWWSRNSAGQVDTSIYLLNKREQNDDCSMQREDCSRLQTNNSVKQSGQYLGSKPWLKLSCCCMAAIIHNSTTCIVWGIVFRDAIHYPRGLRLFNRISAYGRVHIPKHSTGLIPSVTQAVQIRMHRHHNSPFPCVCPLVHGTVSNSTQYMSMYKPILQRKRGSLNP